MMNKKQFWKGILIALLLVLSSALIVYAGEKHIVVTLDFWMDEDSFNFSKDYVQNEYNMTPKEYLEYYIPNNWENFYTNYLSKEFTNEVNRIRATKNNTLIIQATQALEAIQ